MNDNSAIPRAAQDRPKPMASRNAFLLAGATLSALAAMAHLMCIALGGPAYRFFGAGERMAQLADAGHWYPTAMAVGIAAVLAAWAAYALSGAGVIRRLPLLRGVLCAITAAYLARGVGFVALIPYFPGNSLAFWLVSSAVCTVVGVVHLLGLRQAWPHL